MIEVFRLPVPDYLTGQGITAAVLDTGFSPHPDLQRRVIYFKDFTGSRHVMYDDNGHGTHVAGILAGDGSLSEGRYRGMAPGMRLIILKVLDRNGTGSLRPFLQALEWIIQNHRFYGIRIVNISMGTLPDVETNESSLFMKKINQLWDENLCVFAAAGNAGPESGSITSPGINRKLITVGCQEAFPVRKNGQKIEMRYSGRGPVPESCVMKPEVIAYGKDIISCNYRYLIGQKPYIKKSGTSMAVPMAAGAAALLLEAYPELSNKEVKLCFYKSCRRLNLSIHQQGWGMIQPLRLLEAAGTIRN